MTQDAPHPTEDDRPGPDPALFALAAKIRTGAPLTPAQRATVADLVERVAAACAVWDKFAESYPDATPTERAHHMRGALAFVLDRPTDSDRRRDDAR